MTNTWRWEYYWMHSPATFEAGWTELLNQDRRVLFVLGAGFDPRMCVGIEKLVSLNPKFHRKCFLITYDEGEDSPSQQYQPLVAENLARLKVVFDETQIESHALKMWSEDRRRIGSRQASILINSIQVFENFTDVIIDVSALPRSIYFPLIAKALYLLDSSRSATNLHVLIAEDAKYDRSVCDEGIEEDAVFLQGFAGEFDQESAKELPRVWIPILGENKLEQLNRINHLVKAEEVSPMLPSPASNPRRADDLIQEYRELLFDRLRIEPSNLIYAAEDNPFQVYRQICGTVARYEQALEPLGGAHYAISAASSKLLSIGALLAAYELKDRGYRVGIPHVEASGYRVIPGDTVHPKLYSVTVAGECYAV